MPKLLWHALWRVYCPLNSSKYRPQAKMVQCRRPSLPALDLPIVPCQNRSPAHCTAAKLWAAHCATATYAALPTTSVHFHSFTQMRPILHFLVDSGTPQSLPRSPFVAGGLWAIILTRLVLARCWALVWPHSKHVVVDKIYALNRQCSAGPACDCLDHRARAC